MGRKGGANGSLTDHNGARRAQRDNVGGPEHSSLATPVQREGVIGRRRRWCSPRSHESPGQLLRVHAHRLGLGRTERGEWVAGRVGVRQRRCSGNRPSYSRRWDVVWTVRTTWHDDQASSDRYVPHLGCAHARCGRPPVLAVAPLKRTIRRRCEWPNIRECAALDNGYER